MKDLFNCHLNKKELLLEEFKRRRYMRTSDVQAWGLKNMSGRAERNARQFAVDGYIRRISDEQAYNIFGYIGKEEAWEYIGDDRLAA